MGTAGDVLPCEPQQVSGHGFAVQGWKGALVLGSAVEGTVTFALMVCNSPKIRGLHEIIKSEVAGEQTLCFISASLQAGHGERVAELSKMLPRQCQPHGTHQAPAPSHQCSSAGLLMLGSQELRPQQQRRGERASLVPRALPSLWDTCHAMTRPQHPLSPWSCSPGSSPGIPRT